MRLAFPPSSWWLRRLRTRLLNPLPWLIGSAGVLLVVLWLITWRWIQVEYQQADRRAAAAVQEVADTYHAQVLRAVREIDMSLRLLAYMHAQQGATGMAALRAESLLVNEQLFTINEEDAQGRRHAGSPSRGALPSADIWLGSASGNDSDALAVSRPWRPAPDQPWQVSFARPLRTSAGQPDGRVSVTVEAAYFTSAYDHDALGSLGLLAVVRSDGRVLSWRHGDAVGADALLNQTQLMGAVAGQSDLPTDTPGDPQTAASAAPASWVPQTVQGQPGFLAARDVLGARLTVLVGLNAQEQRASADHERRRYLWTATALSLALLCVTVLLVRLDRVARRHQQAQLEARLAHAREVEYLAYHDGLTGLANRSLYVQLLEQQVAQARRQGGGFALMFLDLDRFKLINDTLGHDVGDALLKEVAARLKAVLREADVVARLGGDEFVAMLLEAADAQDAARVARRVLSEMGQPCVLLGHEIRITASIGIAFYPHDGQDEQTLAKHADVAMYQAKQEGRNTFALYAQAQSERTLERLALESALRAALPRGELRLHYQARRDLVTGVVTGAEALLRWQHPDLGLLPAARFVDLAEETGLILPIGRWVLRQGCAQLRHWREHGLAPVRLAINLSPRQFADEALLDDLAAALREHGVDPGWLELEIPETLLMANVEQHLQRLAAFKQLGVHIAIDNFGVGYATLATLRRAALDTIKIDRSLIRDLTLEGADHRLPAAIIEMGHSLRLTVVAKGVETAAQVAFLRRHDCNELQGNFLSEPLSAAQFEVLLQEPTTADERAAPGAVA